MRPEEREEKKFVKKVELLGCKAFKFEVHGLKGAPDRMVLIPTGLIVFIEFKRPGGGVIAHHQSEFINMLRELGFDARVFDNWLEALNYIKSIMEDLNEFDKVVRQRSTRDESLGDR